MSAQIFTSPLQYADTSAQAARIETLANELQKDVPTQSFSQLHALRKSCREAERFIQNHPRVGVALTPVFAEVVSQTRDLESSDAGQRLFNQAIVNDIITTLITAVQALPIPDVVGTYLRSDKPLQPLVTALTVALGEPQHTKTRFRALEILGSIARQHPTSLTSSRIETLTQHVLDILPLVEEKKTQRSGLRILAGLVLRTPDEMPASSTVRASLKPICRRSSEHPTPNKTRDQTYLSVICGQLGIDIDTDWIISNAYDPNVLDDAVAAIDFNDVATTYLPLELVRLASIVEIHPERQELLPPKLVEFVRYRTGDHYQLTLNALGFAALDQLVADKKGTKILADIVGEMTPDTSKNGAKVLGILAATDQQLRVTLPETLTAQLESVSGWEYWECAEAAGYIVSADYGACTLPPDLLIQSAQHNWTHEDRSRDARIVGELAIHKPAITNVNIEAFLTAGEYSKITPDQPILEVIGQVVVVTIEAGMTAPLELITQLPEDESEGRETKLRVIGELAAKNPHSIPESLRPLARRCDRATEWKREQLAVALGEALDRQASREQGLASLITAVQNQSGTTKDTLLGRLGIIGTSIFDDPSDPVISTLVEWIPTTEGMVHRSSTELLGELICAYPDTITTELPMSGKVFWADSTELTYSQAMAAWGFYILAAPAEVPETPANLRQYVLEVSSFDYSGFFSIRRRIRILANVAYLRTHDTEISDLTTLPELFIDQLYTETDVDKKVTVPALGEVVIAADQVPSFLCPAIVKRTRKVDYDRHRPRYASSYVIGEIVLTTSESVSLSQQSLCDRLRKQLNESESFVRWYLARAVGEQAAASNSVCDPLVQPLLEEIEHSSLTDRLLAMEVAGFLIACEPYTGVAAIAAEFQRAYRTGPSKLTDHKYRQLEMILDLPEIDMEKAVRALSSADTAPNSSTIDLSSYLEMGSTYSLGILTQLRAQLQRIDSDTLKREFRPQLQRFVADQSAGTSRKLKLTAIDLLAQIDGR